MARELPSYARRLRDLLIEKGYEPHADGSTNVEMACRVINRRTFRVMKLEKFEKLAKGTLEFSAEDAVQVADGLGFDVKRLLYENPPKYPERPDNLLDELDLIGPPG